MPASRIAGPEKMLNWCEQLEEIRSCINQGAAYDLDHPERAHLQLKKWRIIHRALKDNPFHVSQGLSRDDQWRKVLTHVIEAFDEPDITDWVGVQAQVAGNIRTGIHDLRPRKNGPCYDLLMEFVRDRKRKANAVLRWAQGAENGHSQPSEGTSPNRLTELYRAKK